LTPTNTPTLTPTLILTTTSTPTATTIPLPSDVRLNEILPAPEAIDWDGNGTANQRDEWIELYNGAPTAVDISGWVLADMMGDSPRYTIPAETVLQPGEFAVFYRRTTNIDLANTGDRVRLFKLDGTLADAVTFEALAPDASYSRDETGAWHADWDPSPGAPNLPPPPTATPEP
jgi:hypothetical protein